MLKAASDAPLGNLCSRCCNVITKSEAGMDSGIQLQLSSTAMKKPERKRDAAAPETKVICSHPLGDSGIVPHFTSHPQELMLLFLPCPAARR